MTRTGLILDFGGVLTTSMTACTLGFDRRAGLPEGTLLSLVTEDRDGAALYADLERGAITQTEWNHRTADLLGIKGENLLGRVLADLRPEPMVIDAARAARAAGVKVGIFSNSLGLRPHNPYEPYDFARLYDVVLISEHYRLRKPDPLLYRFMLDLMDLPADACVLVDDNPAHLPPAEALGIATVHATDPAGTVGRLEALLGIPLTGAGLPD